ncbi:peptide chain release factor 2 [Candidatus Omnitrophus magneticus]|uniref:Peptide chain release factor 2 n=1 Tax=Candidatus Omnitrophus magneticus TaxID=1609969 RepID=A0A0F0CMC8_9BACT|nr:peptide chain release factor 2 [Candidatus Omnitrophus magneticus]
MEKSLNHPDVWKNQDEANSLSAKLKTLKTVIIPFKELEEHYNAVKELSEIVIKDDEASLKSLSDELSEIDKGLGKLEFKSLLGGDTDKCNAIVSLNAGAGGTESCDWASMLLRMYLRWVEAQGYTFEIIDQLNGEEAGVKNVMFTVRGEYSFGYLKSETGVHRLVRISPFDANKRRHTSFVSVDVLPELGEDIKIDINESDLKIDTYRSSGAGGQHVNVTDSAVRITHLPTGIVSQCQKERSQHKNKAVAMKILKARLYELERKKQEEKHLEAYENKKRIEWGSQIRSYVLHPYKMVKDHRTSVETSSADRVLDGDLTMFMEAYLKWVAVSKKTA